jgi:endonuclease/exonuclease/phosphatase (EEP) superfamily protein YafD
MIKQIKSFVINLIAGANIATILLMLLAGYSDRLNPEQHPILSVLGMTFPVFLLVNLLFLFLWLTIKWKKAWIPIAGFAAAYVPITLFMPVNMRQEVPEGAIKLISYNVCTYGGNYKYENGFDTVFGYLERQKADIVCLQEDVDSWRRYVFIKYAKIYPYNDTTMLQNNAFTYNCVGIHTRFPIIRKERIWYPSNTNGSVAYYLNTGKDTLLVINNHLEGTHLSESERSNYKRMLRGKMERDTAKAESMFLIEKLGNNNAKRAVQADIVHRYIEEHRQYPTIVCGDFNDTPISYTRRTIAQGLTDCFQTTGKGLGLSYNQKGFYFRIDHILCSPDLQPYNCEIDDDMDASDHYPILCHIKMRENP